MSKTTDPESLDSSQVIWITGASRGLGAAIARGLAGPESILVLMARSLRALRSVAGDAEMRGAAGVVVLGGSVNILEDVDEATRVIKDRFGRIDVLVNCAGISPFMTRIDQIEEAAWSDVIDTNLSGVYRCCRSAIPLMHEGAGSIINVSSIHGTRGESRLSAYSASKGAVEALTRSLASEVAQRGIRVNAVAPGYFETDMTADLLKHDTMRDRLLRRIPLGRFGRPEELVGAIRFLASPDASYITGSTLFVDGGWSSQ